MTSKVDKLTKVFLKNSYGYNKDVNGNKKVSRTLGFVLIYLYLMAIIALLSYKLISLLISVNQPAVFIGLFLLGIGTLIIFQTIFTGTNVYYFSKDVEHVLPLPVKPVELLMAKFNTILITEYITELIIAIVPLFIYGILTGAAVSYYIYAVLILLIFPILPALLASFIIMILMSFAKPIKNKDRFQLFSTIIAIVVAVGLQLVLNQNAQIPDYVFIGQLLKFNGLVDTIGNYFITIQPSIDAMISTDAFVQFLALAKVIGITLIAYVVFIFIGKGIYFRGAIGTSSSGIKSKKVNRIYKENKVSDSYIKKEFKMLFKNPIYFAQCVLPCFLLPIIMAISFGASYNSSGGDISAFLGNIEINTITICIVIGIIQFLSFISIASVTNISRDGKYANFMKYIPISLYKQSNYKILTTTILNSISVLMVLITFYLLKPDAIIYIIAVFLIAMLSNFLLNQLMLIVDLKKPKLKWDTEYAVVKQNMNVIYSIIYACIIIAIIIIYAMFCQDLSARVTLAIFAMFFGVISIIVDRYIFKNQNKLYEKVM